MDLCWKVSHHHSGSKLLAFIAEHLSAALTNRAIKRAIEEGACRVNGRTERFASYVVGAGDEVAFRGAAAEAPRFRVEDILFEDEQFLIYNKPAGLISDDKGVIALLSSYTPLPLYLVHRLDKETSGALIIAKQEAVCEQLASQFKKRQVEKRYLAIVDGIIAADEGTIDLPMVKEAGYQGQSFWAVGKEGNGATATTLWRVKERGASETLVECCPITGRTHQIRVHLAHLSHPVLGDAHYGRRFASKLQPKRLMLHAVEIQLLHPGSRLPIRVTAPLPDDFNQVMRQVRRDDEKNSHC